MITLKHDVVNVGTTWTKHTQIWATKITHHPSLFVISSFYFIPVYFSIFFKRRWFTHERLCVATCDQLKSFTIHPGHLNPIFYPNVRQFCIKTLHPATNKGQWDPIGAEGSWVKIQITDFRFFFTVFTYTSDLVPTPLGREKSQRCLRSRKVTTWPGVGKGHNTSSCREKVTTRPEIEKSLNMAWGREKS